MPWWRAGTLSTLIWHLNLGNSQVEDAVSSGNIIDVAPLLPPFMDAQDHAVIIQRCPCVAKGKSTRAMANSFVGALPVSPSRLRPSPPPPPPSWVSATLKPHVCPPVRCACQHSGGSGLRESCHVCLLLVRACAEPGQCRCPGLRSAAIT